MGLLKLQSKWNDFKELKFTVSWILELKKSEKLKIPQLSNKIQGKERTKAYRRKASEWL